MMVEEGERSERKTFSSEFFSFSTLNPQSCTVYALRAFMRSNVLFVLLFHLFSSRDFMRKSAWHESTHAQCRS